MSVVPRDLPFISGVGETSLNGLSTSQRAVKARKRTTKSRILSLPSIETFSDLSDSAICEYVRTPDRLRGRFSRKYIHEVKYT